MERYFFFNACCSWCLYISGYDGQLLIRWTSGRSVDTGCSRRCPSVEGVVGRTTSRRPPRDVEPLLRHARRRWIPHVSSANHSSWQFRQTLLLRPVEPGMKINILKNVGMLYSVFRQSWQTNFAYASAASKDKACFKSGQNLPKIIGSQTSI